MILMFGSSTPTTWLQLATICPTISVDPTSQLSRTDLAWPLTFRGLNIRYRQWTGSRPLAATIWWWGSNNPTEVWLAAAEDRFADQKWTLVTQVLSWLAQITEIGPCLVMVVAGPLFPQVIHLKIKITEKIFWKNWKSILKNIKLLLISPVLNILIKIALVLFHQNFLQIKSPVIDIY